MWTLLKQIAGPRAILLDDYFEPASNKDILVRILDNLKQIFWRNKSWDQSKLCLDKQRHLLPDQAELNIQLGAIYEMQGKAALAQDVYVQAIERTDNQKIRDAASKRLLALEAKPRNIH